MLMAARLRTEPILGVVGCDTLFINSAAVWEVWRLTKRRRSVRALVGERGRRARWLAVLVSRCNFVP